MLLRFIMLLSASAPVIARATFYNPVTVDILTHLKNVNEETEQTISYLNEVDQSMFLPKVTGNIVKITNEVQAGIADASNNPNQIVKFSPNDQLALCRHYGKLVEDQVKMLETMAQKKVFLSSIFLTQGVPNGVPKSVEDLFESLYALSSALVPIVPTCKEDIVLGQKALEATILKVIQQSMQH